MDFNKEKKRTRFFSIGIVCTFIWIVIIIFIFWSKGFPDELGEWGEFLGGALSPVALLWVVLGYMQQGEELKSNTEALKLQQVELKNQADSSAKQVALLSAQEKRFIEPILLLQKEHKNNSWAMKNIGGVAFNISVQYMTAKPNASTTTQLPTGGTRVNQDSYQLEQQTLLAYLDEKRMQMPEVALDGMEFNLINYLVTGYANLDAPFTFCYQDRLGRSYSKDYFVKNNSIEIEKHDYSPNEE